MSSKSELECWCEPRDITIFIDVLRAANVCDIMSLGARRGYGDLKT